MPDLEVEASAIEQLVQGEAEITREAILAILELIERDYLVRCLGRDAQISDIREQVVGAMKDNVEWITRAEDMFHRIVVAELLKGGVLHEETIPEEPDFPAGVLERAKALGMSEKFLNEKTLYVVMNSSNSDELRMWIRAAKYAADCTQVVLPILHHIRDIDPSVEERLRKELEDQKVLEAYTDMDLIGKYCFNKENSQPYVTLFAFENHGRVPTEVAEKFMDTVAAKVLRILQNYFRGDLYISGSNMGITEDDVKNGLDTLRQELTEINEGSLDEGGEEDKFAKFARGRKAKLEPLVDIPSAEIFEKLQEVYKYVRDLEMEGAGIKGVDIAKRMREERPDLVEVAIKYYFAMRNPIWGYRLGQDLMAGGLKRSE